MTLRRSAGPVLRCITLAALVAINLTACKSSHPSAGAGAQLPIPVTAVPTTPPVIATPSPTATLIVRVPVTLHPTVTPHPTVIPHPSSTARRPVLGDLTIHLVRGGCGFYSDTSGGLWLNPRLEAGWTGPGPFPAANLGFSMTTNYGKATAGGPVTSTTPFTWAIGGEPAVGNAWLGHTVKITVTIDPGNDVAETNESNNVAIITVVVPASLPFSASGSNGDYKIPCS
jgi:hypothetical protein